MQISKYTKEAGRRLHMFALSAGRDDLHEVEEHQARAKLFAGIREMVCEYAGVGDSKCADDFARIFNFNKGVCLPNQLFCIIAIIRGEELVKILVAATEGSACGNYFWGEQDAGASAVQKGHLPDSLSSLTRVAFSDSKLRHISRLAEKSTLPRLRAFSSAVRTKRIAASPDKTGMLLIASAMSCVPCLKTHVLYHKFGQCGKWVVPLEMHWVDASRCIGWRPVDAPNGGERVHPMH